MEDDVTELVNYMQNGHCFIRATDYKSFKSAANILGVHGLCDAAAHQHFDKLENDENAHFWDNPPYTVRYHCMPWQALMYIICHF
jgi:predicted RNA-binding protein with PUA-like domain